MTLAQRLHRAIEQSIHEDRIVDIHLDADQDMPDAIDTLTSVCDYDDCIDTNEGYTDVWGEDEDGNTWRLYIHCAE
ncbi:MAG: hypothetical protein WC340_18540 [Kiritimatiellia bacterium]